ncbi:Uncharacterised protein [Candidatus Burarchaeum australiense]|nr:Uncharacterised protein [Candidatus Burarchaeum australiense]
MALPARFLPFSLKVLCRFRQTSCPALRNISVSCRRRLGRSCPPLPARKGTCPARSIFSPRARPLALPQAFPWHWTRSPQAPKTPAASRKRKSPRRLRRRTRRFRSRRTRSQGARRRRNPAWGSNTAQRQPRQSALQPAAAAKTRPRPPRLRRWPAMRAARISGTSCRRRAGRAGKCSRPGWRGSPRSD